MKILNYLKNKRLFLMASVIQHADISKEILETLKSIDTRLENLESCIGENNRGYGKRKFITTGHWND